MKTKLLCIACAVIISSLVSCQTTQKPFQPKRAPSGFTIDEEDTLVHLHSGGKFPHHLSSFLRGNPHLYDPQGYDVSVEYSLYESGAAAATVYIYPSVGIDVEEHFDSLKDSIMYYHPRAHQVEESGTSVALDDGSVLSGYRAVYTFEEIFHGRKQMVESQAFVFKKGNWFIAFRITYPVIENQELIRKEVDLMVTVFDYAAVR